MPARPAVRVLTPEIAARSGRDMDVFSEREVKDGGGVGSLEFAALMRKLDRLDNSYRA
ncbi:MAG: hypothetical protein R3E83_16910 [Burkholderiaceae bacterium]